MFAWLRLFYELFLYLLNVWIVTDHRIIENEQHGFFSRSVSELNIANVEDVTIEIKGFFQTFLNFGNIDVQDSAKNDKFQFSSAADPLIVKDAIVRAHNAFLVSHPGGGEPATL